MNIIPIYKANKRLETTDPDAFRPVALAETLFKLAETVFISKLRGPIENNMGDFQNAYKKGHGTYTALNSLNEQLKDIKSGYLCSADIKSAFDKM